MSARAARQSFPFSRDLDLNRGLSTTRDGCDACGAEVGATQSQTSSDLRHKPASIHGVRGGAMTPAASRPPLLRCYAHVLTCT